MHFSPPHSDPRRDATARPLISIITSTYRAAEYLPQAIASVRAQSFDNFEWIIIDGASKDGTLDILRENEDVIDHWQSESDKGIYDAWNKGLKRASGQWVCFLGADDFFWSNDALERMAAALAGLPAGVRIAYGQVMLLAQGGKPLYPIGEPWAVVRKRFSSVMCLPHPATFHHRELFRRHGEFDTAFRIAGDYEFLLRELPKQEAAFVEDLVVTGMSVGGISSSLATSREMLFEMRRATRKNGHPLPGWPWMAALARFVVRQMLWGLLGDRAARRLLDAGRRLMGKPAHWTRT